MLRPWSNSTEAAAGCQMVQRSVQARVRCMLLKADGSECAGKGPLQAIEG